MKIDKFFHFFLLNSALVIFFEPLFFNGPLLSASPTNPEKKIVLFLGDSLTAGYGVSINQAYPSLLKTRLEKEGFSEVEFINASISGATTAAGLSILESRLNKRLTHLVLALGANDGKQGTKTSETRKNLENIIRKAKESKIKVLLAGMMAPPNFGRQFTTKFAKIFPNLAETHGLELMPFLLADVAGEKELNQSDSIHPNEKGHGIIAKNMWPHLKKILSS